MIVDSIPDCQSCWRRAKYRVVGHQDVGDKIRRACHLHLVGTIDALFTTVTEVSVQPYLTEPDDDSVEEGMGD